MVGGDSSLALSAPYDGPSAADQVYGIVLNGEAAANGLLTAAATLLTPADRVTSVFGRIGAVAAQAGDYAAAQVSFTPAGGIAATEVQGALAQLGDEKADLAGAVFTGTVTLAAGSTDAAALMLQAGVSLAEPALGAVEFDGMKILITVEGPVRKTIAFTDGDITGTAANVTGIVAIANGGTGADTALAALVNLGAAPIASPALTGSPTAPTPDTSNSSTAIATTAFVKAQGYITAAEAPVLSVAGKTGVVTLVVGDVTGAAPLASPALTGVPTAPTPGTSDSSTTLATTAFVKAQGYITAAGAPVLSVAGKTGVVTLVVGDVSGAAPLASPALTGVPTAPTPGTSDNSTTLATTAFVKAQGYINAAGAPVLSVAGKTGVVTLVVGDVTGAAPLASPALTGVPTAPTPGTSDSSTTLATTAFVKAQGYITAAGAPVLSVAGKTGVVTLAVGDVSGAAPLVSPALSGAPTAPTPGTSDNSTALATTAFVKAQGYITAAGAPVLSVAGKTGVVTLAVGDVSGAAPLASPALTGSPVAPTPVAGDNSTAIATTAFVKTQNYVTPSQLTAAGGIAWSAKSANFTTVAGNGYFIDTSGGPVTATLPAAPAVGDQVRMVDVASTFGTNNLVVARNGQLIMGLSEDMTVSTTYASVQLIFAGASYGWRLI